MPYRGTIDWREDHDLPWAALHCNGITRAPVGPELTGSGRMDLDYLLENIIDPSAIVPNTYLMSIVALNLLSGTVLAKTDQLFILQTAVGEQRIDIAQIGQIKPTTTSMMPKGLLEGLTDQQLRDMAAYLASEAQVPLPAA